MLDLFENNEIVFLCDKEIHEIDKYHNVLACWDCEVYYCEKPSKQHEPMD